MSIKIKFFASLRERVGKSEAELEATFCDAADLTTLKVWQATTGKDTLDSNILIAINMEYVDSQHVVSDGDEVAFFPPVTGG
jgi:molybdopterin synthase sulfur carrier subunit